MVSLTFSLGQQPLTEAEEVDEVAPDAPIPCDTVVTDYLQVGVLTLIRARVERATRGLLYSPVVTQQGPAQLHSPDGDRCLV